jgi:hypothetical protein
MILIVQRKIFSGAITNTSIRGSYKIETHCLQAQNIDYRNLESYDYNNR